MYSNISQLTLYVIDKDQIKVLQLNRIKVKDQNFIIRPMERLSGLVQGMSERIHRPAQLSNENPSLFLF